MFSHFDSWLNFSISLGSLPGAPVYLVVSSVHLLRDVDVYLAGLWPCLHLRSCFSFRFESSKGILGGVLFTLQIREEYPRQGIDYGRK
jgi:hypothetical protein